MPDTKVFPYYEIPVPMGYLKVYLYTSETLLWKLKKKTPTHDHPDYELHYIQSGEVRFHFDDRQITVSPSSLILIQPNEYHYLDYDSQQETPQLFSFRLEVKSPTSSASSNEKKAYTALIALLSQTSILHDKSCVLLPYLQSLNREFNEKEPGYYLSMQTLSSRILIELIRLAGVISKEIFPDEKLKHISNWRAQLEDIFYRRYMENIHLQDVADTIKLSPRQTARLILQEYNINFVEKLNDIRIHVAAEQIQNTDKSFRQISKDCGFSNYNYFSTCFRKKMRCSPIEYQKNCRMPQKQKTLLIENKITKNV